MGYALGDVITLTWKSQNAQRAVWKPVVDQNTGTVNGNVVPEGTPPVNGTATTIANLTGFQKITLQVTGTSGFGECSTDFSVSPSNAKPSMTVGSVRFTGANAKYTNDTYTDVTVSGTITNGALYNDEVNIVLIDPTYTGPFDYSSIYSGPGKQYFYSGGSTPGARDDSQAFKNWSDETFVRKEATQVRVLVYPFFYNRTVSSTQPVINQVFTISQ